MRALALCLALGASGCVVVVGPLAGSPPPVPWRLVEEESGGGRVLVLERDEGHSWRVEVRLSRERAPTGEVVDAELWLPGAEGRHRIEARPDRTGVSILGPREFEVDGEERVTVRFTCAMPGRGGIAVLVKD